MDRSPESHRVGLGALSGHPLGPGVDTAVTEPPLPRVQGHVATAVEPALEIARVEQGQSDAGLVGGVPQGEAHRVRVAVRFASGPVVHVVELPDDGHTGQHHLGEDGPGQIEVGVGVQLGRNGVHLFTPAPEVAATAVGPAAQGPVEGVTVRVGHAGQGDPGQTYVVGFGVDSGLHLAQHAISGDETHPSSEAACQPGKLAPERGHSAPPDVP